MTTNQTIDGVSREFVREGRYIVVKPDYEDDIRTERLRNYIEEMCFHTPDCVVVEADWPEYEPVCRMIEARVIGNPTELDAAKATISQLQGLVAELRALLDAPAETEVVHEVQWNSIHGPEGWKVVDAPTFHRCTGRLWDRRLTRKPAAQPQGEPVAEIASKYGDPEAFGDRELITLKDISKFPYGTKLYADQPAPVAVALPVDPERERLMEIVQQYPNVDPLKYDAAVRTLRK